MVNVTEKDFATLCICAVRYCHGRQSYMPSLVIRIVEQNLQKISTNDLLVMLKDCEFQKEKDLYGDPFIDKPGWMIWKSRLEEEISKRK